MKTTKADKILIVVLFSLSVFFAFYITKSHTNAAKRYISIQVNGEEIKTVDFVESEIGKTYEIKTKFGRNVIEIGDERVRVIEASCPDQIDVKQGWISQTGELIVCLPNRLIIEIKNKDEGQDVIDNVAY
ncbi:NusG domain II-containing protein [Peptoniphilaceae bacterium SGI.131]